MVDSTWKRGLCIQAYNTEFEKQVVCIHDECNLKLLIVSPRNLIFIIGNITKNDRNLSHKRLALEQIGSYHTRANNVAHTAVSLVEDLKPLPPLHLPTPPPRLHLLYFRILEDETPRIFTV